MSVDIYYKYIVLILFCMIGAVLKLIFFIKEYYYSIKLSHHKTGYFWGKNNLFSKTTNVLNL